MHDLLVHLLTVENLIAVLTLTMLEIVLGIDNIIFLSILTGKLPPEQRRKGRLIGLGLAMGARICLLLGISWVMGLTRDLFTVFGQGISGQDLVLILGGCFLIYKSTKEIHHKLEGGDELTQGGSGGGRARFGAIIVQIILVDLVFSLDSVITAVGMVNSGGGHGADPAVAAAVSDGARHAKLAVMILAVMIAVGVMMLFAGAIGDFVERHPTIKVLALSFLIMVGLMLVAEGFGQHISKGYIYFAMAFSLGVEAINIRMRPKGTPSVGGITGKINPGEHLDLPG